MELGRLTEYYAGYNVHLRPHVCVCVFKMLGVMEPIHLMRSAWKKSKSWESLKGWGATGQ